MSLHDVADRLTVEKDISSGNPANSGSNYFPLYMVAGIIFFVCVNYLTRYMVPDTISKNFQSR